MARAGETAAAELYLRLGFAIVDRNYRARAGEIDVIARRADVVVFCEVKTRSSERWGVPSEAVSYRKQMKLRALASQWLADRRPGLVDIRFDVVSVVARGPRLEITHIPDAF